ncbi:MAG TPA: hypothetical protein VN962_21415 [Polyangia bacterium]|nr:hypothetical protein [Polyangia bacterium]
MSRAKVAGVVFVVCGLTAVGVAGGTSWLRRSPPAERPVAQQQQQDALRNAARVVQLAARAAAEPGARNQESPPSTDAAAPNSGDQAGETRWLVNAPHADAKAEGSVLCGGEVCAAGQFCCGPPECGHCANRLTGPRCPAVCP